MTFLLALALVLQAGVARTVLATVVDPRNRAVVDLDVDDFVIRDSGAARDVLAARVADYPVVVFIDNSPQASAEFESIRAAANRFITRIGQRPVALGTLGGTPTLVATFDDDRATVLARLNAVVPEATGGTAVVQGMATAARAIRALDVPFSSIVVVTTSPAAGVGEAPTGWLQEILESHAIANVVVRRAADVAATPDLNDLRALTEQTHGQLTTVYSAVSYGVALDHLADGMAGEMMIDYLVPGDAPSKADVTVGVKVPGLRVKGLGVR
jgi:hypothetical protein